MVVCGMLLLLSILALAGCGDGGGSDDGISSDDDGGSNGGDTNDCGGDGTGGSDTTGVDDGLFTLPEQGLNRGVNSVALAADGSCDIYVGGTFTVYNDVSSNYIIRFNGDGTVDSTFVVGDGFDNSVTAIAATSDGSGDIYVGGWFTSYNGSASPSIIRLNSDGSVDSAFDVGTGFINTYTNSTYISTIVPLNDESGDIYVGGIFISYNGSASNRIIRLNSDGSVDTDFAVGSGFVGGVKTIALAADGSGDIYVGGTFGSYDGNDSRNIIRLNSDGTVDTAFAVGSGFSSASSSSVESIAPAADGSGAIYVGGFFEDYNGTACNHVIRLNADGTVDTVFATGSGFDNSVTAVVATGDGSGDIYVGGGFTSYNGTACEDMIRLNSDGTVDSAFSAGTGFSSPYSHSSVATIALATDGSGDLYAGGMYSTSYDGTPSNYLIRLNSDGTVDTAYSATTGLDYAARRIVPAGDGSGDIYLGGNSFTRYNGTVSNRILRLDSDGQVVAGFATGSGFDASVSSIVLAPDGSGDIYVGGFFTSYNDAACNYLARLNSDGTVDNAFSVVGTGFDAGVSAIAPAADGSGDIYVGGGFTSYNGTSARGVVRLNSDGTVDNSFSVVGTGFDRGISILTPATDGSGDIYVGGFFTNYDGNTSNYIVRLNSDGTLDSAFSTGTGFSDAVRAIIPAPDASGDIYAGGSFISYNGTSAKGIIRLNSDGTVDSGFAVDPGISGGTRFIAPAADGSGDIYLGGFFAKHVMRLNSDGTLDSAFATGASFNSWVEALAPAIDGSGNIYCSGYFTSYQGTTVMGIIALGPDGSIQ